MFISPPPYLIIQKVSFLKNIQFSACYLLTLTFLSVPYKCNIFLAYDLLTGLGWGAPYPWMLDSRCLYLVFKFMLFVFLGAGFSKLFPNIEDAFNYILSLDCLILVALYSSASAWRFPFMNFNVDAEILLVELIGF